MASAVPLYQWLPICIWAGTSSMNSSSRGDRKLKPWVRWRLSEWDLYWVSTRIWRKSELMQLLRVKSMIR